MEFVRILIMVFLCEAGVSRLCLCEVCEVSMCDKKEGREVRRTLSVCRTTNGGRVLSVYGSVELG